MCIFGFHHRFEDITKNSVCESNTMLLKMDNAFAGGKFGYMQLSHLGIHLHVYLYDIYNFYLLFL